jgi:UDP-3-O-[3-hydroxymyristoyl] glucosamine N-acyltransferase
MNLQDILQGLEINADYNGDQSFESLGKINGKHTGKFCSFCSAPRYLQQISDNVHLLLTTAECANDIQKKGISICVVGNPSLVFSLVHNHLTQDANYLRPQYKTDIGANCSISKQTFIADVNVTIGNNVTIEEFVSIKENTVIGDNTIIRVGSIVGGEGFEQKRNGDCVVSVKHVGGVIIGRDVELQQRTCVDKAIFPWDDTVIGDNCRTAGFVHIAHAGKIGRCVLVAASAEVSGSVVIGDNVWLGPTATITNAVQIGEGAHVNIGSVVTKDVAAEENVTGNFAIEHARFIDFIKSIR